MSTSTYTVERSATIAAEPQRVYGLLADFHRWLELVTWEDLDPDHRRSSPGPVRHGRGLRVVGQPQGGTGRMEITVREAPSVQIALEFLKPFKSSTRPCLVLAAGGAGGTQVTWWMVGRKTLMTMVMGVFSSMDKMVGPDFEKGLGRLKDAVEAPSTR